MISGMEWIPQGVADPNPKKYELSRAEKELLREQARIQKRHELGEASDEGEEDEEDSDGNDEEEVGSEDGMDATTETTQKDESQMTASEIIASQKVDLSTLPADLRMDDYPEDDEDEEGDGAAMGDLLIGDDGGGGMGMGIGIDEDGRMDTLPNIEGEDDNDEDGASVESLDSDEDEDLEDVPDTREYDPTDIPGLQSMAFSGHTDPHSTPDDDDDSLSNYSASSDRHDTNLRPSDALLLSAKTDADSEFSSLEVHLYERDSGNLFVHHDVPLPSYPLCLAHGTVAVGGAGSYAAVGTFEPGIEIWNLDVLDALEPVCTLGGEDLRAEEEEWARRITGQTTAQNNKKKKKNRRNVVSTPRHSAAPKLRPHSHDAAVMSLSWNKIHRQVLASGSADRTVKLWDVTRADDPATGGHAATLSHHTDKVAAVAWHPSEGTLLASGGYDRAVAVVDARIGGGGSAGGSSNSGCKKGKLGADCEAIAWDPHRPHLLTAAGEDGAVCCWDVRKLEGGGCYWKFVAHEMGGCSDISYNSNVPGMLATCAVDKTVTLWDTLNATDQPNQAPVRCYNKEMNVGQLFSVSFYPSSKCLLATGGGGGEPALWDLEGEEFFAKRFADRVGKKGTDGAVIGDGATGVVEGTVEDEAKEGGGTEDFEAEMATGGGGVTDAKVPEGYGKETKKKKKKKKKKPKAHRKGQ